MLAFSASDIEFLQDQNKTHPSSSRWKRFKFILTKTINSFFSKWKEAQSPWKVFLKNHFQLVDQSLLFEDTQTILTNLVHIAKELNCPKENVEFLKNQSKQMPSGETVRRYLTDKIGSFILGWKNLVDEKRLIEEAEKLLIHPSTDLRKMWKEIAEKEDLTATKFCKLNEIPKTTFNDWYTGKVKTSYCEFTVAKFIVSHS